MSREKINIPIVHHPTSALLKEHASSCFDKHDFGNHGNLLAQQLTNLTPSAQGIEKHSRLALKTRNPRAAINIQSDDFFEKQGFSVDH